MRISSYPQGVLVVCLVALTNACGNAYAACETGVFDASNLMAFEEGDVDMEAARAERHAFIELFQKNDADNLLMQHPNIAMDAYQNLNAINLRYPPLRVKPDGLSNGYVNYYPLYHSALKENGFKQIVGQYAAVEGLVKNVEAGSNGERGGVKTITFEGGAGTGKTLFLGIIESIFNYFPVHDARDYQYTIEWFDLYSIPGLRDVVRTVPDGKGGEIEVIEVNTNFESPISIMPEELQQAAIRRVTPSVMEKVGSKPAIPTLASSRNTHIRDMILDHYRKVKGHKLSPLEMVEALNNHCRLKRFFPSATGHSGKIGYQGKDIDWAGLSLQDNPIMKNFAGSSHPFAYFDNGKILRAQGGLLLFDEFWRNPETFRDFTLDIQESRVVQRGGSQSQPLNAIIIAASNSESIEKAKADGTSKAQLDRTSLKPMHASTDPIEVSKLLFVMKGIENVVQEKLLGGRSADADDSAEGESAPVMENGQPKLVAEPANLDDLYPLRLKENDPFLTPERRYGLSFKRSANQPPIAISPWTVALMAYVTAASRMETRPEKAEKAGQALQQTVNSLLFRDPITRIKAYLGQYKTNSAQREELNLLSDLLKEGANGLSARDAADIWFTELINAAQKPENDNTASPVLARQVFIDTLYQGGFKNATRQDLVEWTQLMERVVDDLILPAIEADINFAMSDGANDVTGAYEDIIRELIAIGEDKTATTYQTASGQPAPINQDRLTEIRRIFREQQKQDLSPQEIINLEATYGRATSSGERRLHPGLESALRKYQADLVMKQVSFSQLAEYAKSGTGHQNVQLLYNHLVFVMKYKLGYNARGIRDAIQLHDMRQRQRALAAQRRQ